MRRVRMLLKKIDEMQAFRFFVELFICSDEVEAKLFCKGNICGIIKSNIFLKGYFCREIQEIRRQ